MYLVIVFNDFENDKINCFCLFDTIKAIIEWSNGLLRYSDVKKNYRRYRTYKSFFRILEVERKDEIKYFPKYKKFIKIISKKYHTGGLSRDVLDS